MVRADRVPVAGYASNQYDYGPVQLAIFGELAPLHHHVGDYNIESNDGGLTTRPHPPDCIGEEAMTNFESKTVACRFSQLSSPPPLATTTSSSTGAVRRRRLFLPCLLAAFGCTLSSLVWAFHFSVPLRDGWMDAWPLYLLELVI